MLTTAEKLTNIALALLILGAYAALALRLLGAPRLSTVRARVADLLSRTEPAIFLDSARAVVFLGWLRFMPSADALAASLARSPELALPKGIFSLIDVATIPVSAIVASIWIYRIALVLAALGIAVRASSALAAIANVFAWSVAFSFEHTAHFHAVPLILLGLALAPIKSPTIFDYARAAIARRPLSSTGAYPVWVRWAAIFAVSTAYFQAGIEKLIRSGPLWINGTTLAGHLLRVGTEAGQRLAEAPHTVLVLASILALAWELSFGLVLFFPRLRIFGAISALAFHAGLSKTMALGFPHLTYALLFLVPPYEIAQVLFRRAGAPSTAGVASSLAKTRARAAALAVLLALQWVPTFVRGGAYPFLSYDMFNGWYKGGELLVRRAHLYARDRSDAPWTELDPTEALAFSSMHFTEQIFYRYVSENPRHAKYVATRTEYCKELLDHVRSSVRPAASELRVAAETIVAGAPSAAKTTELVQCRH